MPILDDPAYTQDAIAGPVNRALLTPDTPPPQDQNALDVLAAAARGNVGGALYDRITTPDPDIPSAPPGWDPLDHVQGYEGHAKDLWDAQTPSQLEGRKMRIDRGRQDEEVLRKTGFWGTAAEMAYAGTDPSFLVSIAVPEIKIAQLAKYAKTAKTINAVAQGAAAGAAYEGEMQALKTGRAAGQSLYGVGSVALMSGVLGHLMSHVPPSKMKPIYDAIEAEAGEALARSEAGAAAVSRPTTLSEESIARGAAGVSRAMAKTPLLGTDLDKIMASGNVSAHTAVQELADVPQILGKNEAGIATPRSVEAAVQKHDAALADFIDHAADQWAQYAKRVPKDQRLSKRDFYENIAKASRREDSIGVPEIDASARFLRQKIFDPLWERSKQLGLAEDKVKTRQDELDAAAVDDYVKAQSSQLYADYAARTRNALRTREQTGDVQGDAAKAADTSELIRSEAERAIAVEQGIFDVGAGKVQGVFDAANKKGKFELAAARDELSTSARKPADYRRYIARARVARDAIADAESVKSKAMDAERSRFNEATKEHRAARDENIGELAPDSRKEFLKRARAANESGVADADPAVNDMAALLQKQASGKLKEIAPARRTSLAGPEIKVTADDTGGLSVKSPNGETIAQETDGYLRATRSDTAAYARKGGEGTARYIKLLDEAEQRGLTLSSDVSVSKDQVGVYKRLKQLGLDVRENPHEISETTGNLVSKDPRVPVFEVRKPPGFKPSSASKVVGAQSYFRRMFDRDAIRGNLAEWHQTLFNHFSKSGDAFPAEVHAAVDDVTNKIMHNDVGQANFATKVTVPAAGPLKERTLDIPDEVIEKFLINDPQRVAQAYVRELAPQVEMAQAFGDVDMKGRLGEISDEYGVKREQLRASVKDPAQLNKKLEKLAIEEKDTLEAVVRIRDRVLGRAGRISPDASEGTRRAVNVSRGWRNFVASARLGGTAVTGGIMDTAKIAAQYGFMPTVKKLTQLVASPAFRDLSRSQARRVGAAVEAALSKRVQVAYDGAITEGWTQTMANGVYKYTGLNHITDFNRTLAATLMEDSVLKAAGRVAEGKALPPFERARLASLGIGDNELAGIAEQVAKHGGDADGIQVSGSADWTDKRLADIYDSAILKESKIAVQQPGAADRVWWMDKETGKLIGQLKTFSLSSPTRLLAGGLQMAGQGQYGKAARFFGYMMMGGYLTHAIRQTIAGKIPTTDPQTAAFEAFTESGLGGVIPDLLSPVGRRLGVLGESVRYSDRNALSAYGGPALGAANDLYDFAFNRTQGGLSAKDLHMMRRMIPWNNVWWLRREINALEGETAEAFDLQGADQASFGERMLRTDALPSQRDGAGIPVQ